jgi:hypothetical protein
MLVSALTARNWVFPFRCALRLDGGSRAVDRATGISFERMPVTVRITTESPSGDAAAEAMKRLRIVSEHQRSAAVILVGSGRCEPTGASQQQSHAIRPTMRACPAKDMNDL